MEFADKHYLNNVVEFNHIDTSLTDIGFSFEQKNCIYKILSTILNLGNIKFKNNPSMNDTCLITEESQPFLENLTVLLNIEKDKLNDIFTNHTIEVSGSEIK